MTGRAGRPAGGAAPPAPAILDETAVRELVAARRDDPRCTEMFEDLLRESHPLYAGSGAAEVIRIRGWLLLALAHGGLADSSLPYALEELESAHDPYLTAVAASALRRRPAPSSRFVPALLAALFYIRFRDDAVSLSEYGGYGVGGERTTAVVEILRTLSWLGPEGRDALPRLRALQAEGPPPRTAALLEEAIAAIEADPCCGSRSADAAIEADPCCGSRSATLAGRAPAGTPDVEFEDHDGERVRFADFLVGRPSIVTFFYTRCDNPTKCPLTITRLGRAQRMLRERGLGQAVRTAAITYDPGFDEPARLRRFARTWGAELDGDHRMLRSVDGMAEISAYFDLGVNFVSSVVNRHRIEVFVLDATGRISTAATRLQWDETEIVAAALALR